MAAAEQNFAEITAAAQDINELVEELNVDHEMQKLRQDYMTELLERILIKKETMEAAAEVGERCA